MSSTFVFTDKQRDPDRQMDILTITLKSRPTHRPKDRQTDTWTDIRTDPQAGRQTDPEIYKCKDANSPAASS